MRNYFIFLPDSGGMVDSRELSIHIEHLPDIQRAPERVERIIVPGRSGTLTKSEGENVYDSYTKTFDIIALDKEKIPSIHRLLRGNGKIIFSNETQFRYTVSITDGWSFNRFFREWHRATLSMETQPFKESVEEKINRGIFAEDVAAEEGLEYGKGYKLTLYCNTDVPCPFFAELSTDKSESAGSYWMYTNEFRNRGIMFWCDNFQTSKIYVDNEKGTVYSDIGRNMLRYTRGYNFPQHLQPGQNKLIFRSSNMQGVIVRHRGWFL